MIKRYYIENCNFPGEATFFSERYVIGESWPHDKKYTDIIGYITNDYGKKDTFDVVTSHEYYDDNECELLEHTEVIESFDKYDDALEFAKDYFATTEKKD